MTRFPYRTEPQRSDAMTAARDASERLSTAGTPHRFRHVDDVRGTAYVVEPVPGDAPPSEAAVAYARQSARALLAGRKGHGGGPCVARRLTEVELIALIAVSFRAGQASKS